MASGPGLEVNAPGLPPRSPPLAPEVAALLPAGDDAPRCAAHAVAIGSDPGGTAIAADAVVLVEAPLPWPKPVFASGLLEGFAPMMDLHVGPARVLATVPHIERDEHRYIPVELHWRFGSGTRSVRFEADGRDGLRALFEHLSHHSPADPVPPDASFATVGSADNERAVLICTQGSHDVCCGSEGSRLAADLEAVLRAYRDGDIDEPSAGAPTPSERVRVHRVSHTGGHRFAPTAMTLPDGRMWAGIEAGELASILDQTADAADLASRCRGWWGAATGPAQVGERAVFAEVGWPLEHMARSVRFQPSANGWNVEVVAVDAGRAWTVSVEEARTVPTIACRALGGLPAKPATEFKVTDIWETSR